MIKFIDNSTTDVEKDIWVHKKDIQTIMIYEGDKNNPKSTGWISMVTDKITSIYYDDVETIRSKKTSFKDITEFIIFRHLVNLGNEEMIVSLMLPIKHIEVITKNKETGSIEILTLNTNYDIEDTNNILYKYICNRFSYRI